LIDPEHDCAGGIAGMAKMEIGALMVETLGKHWTFDSLYRAFVGFLMWIPKIRISHPPFSYVLIFKLSSSSLNEVSHLRLAVASRIYYKSFHYFILLAS
jgi:hypothetical protein